MIEIGITRTQVDSKVYESIVLPNEPLVLIMNKDHEIGAAPDRVKPWKSGPKPGKGGPKIISFW